MQLGWKTHQHYLKSLIIKLRALDDLLLAHIFSHVLRHFDFLLTGMLKGYKKILA